MNNLISKNDILENSTYFWSFYFSLVRGFDNQKEINIDEALEQALGIDFNEVSNWSQDFFKSNEEGAPKSIGGKLSEQLSFQIDFTEEEIVFFINDSYIGNLGGHFEAWSLTLEEITHLEKFDSLFLLLLPMVGIEKDDAEKAINLISKHLQQIPVFEDQSNYIATCITNGLLMDGKFYLDEKVGLVNNQNHSVRNIEKYPENIEEIIKLNNVLKQLL